MFSFERLSLVTQAIAEAARAAAEAERWRVEAEAARAELTPLREELAACEEMLKGAVQTEMKRSELAASVRALQKEKALVVHYLVRAQ
eukprot:2566452-Pyramimonas_sp.AAC.1